MGLSYLHEYAGRSTANHPEQDVLQQLPPERRTAGTSDAVYAYEPARDEWRTLPNLPTARHGLAVVGVGSTIYVIGGGPRPGLSVSAANEALDL